MIREICEHVTRCPKRYHLSPGKIVLFNLGGAGEVSLIATLFNASEFANTWAAYPGADAIVGKPSSMYVGIIHDGGICAVELL